MQYRAKGWGDFLQCNNVRALAIQKFTESHSTSLYLIVAKPNIECGDS